MMMFRTLSFGTSIRRTKSKTAVATVTAMLLAICPSIFAQQSTKIPRVGFLLVGGSPDPSRRDAFRQGLRELGYIEEKNIHLEWRFADGKLDRLDELSMELVRRKVDVFVTSGNMAIRAAKRATQTIPIVMALASDPVENGFVESLARPRGNITGLTTLGGQLSGKRVELLKEILPPLSRLLVLGNSAAPGNAQTVQQTADIAKALGVTLVYKDVSTVTDLEPAFKKAPRSRPEAALILPNAVLLLHRKTLVELSARHRLPTMYDAREYVQIGGLMSYATDAADLFKRAAIYVDKILKGAKPGDLPVEQPTKFEFIVNLKAAKQIGLTIPPNVLARADKVIR